MKDIFIEAHIADIHFGAMDVNKQYKILKEQFIDRLMDMPILDIVSINGDLFHHKFMANSTVVLVALQFIYDLIGVCKAKDATLIVISGTYSHDADQIKLIYPLAQQAWDNGVDVRIVEKISFEWIKNKLVLCIPEEYGKPMQYYTDPLYHSGIYDACYMHGTYRGSIYGKDIPSLNTSREPVFEMANFCNCAGPIISGHVHTPGCFDKHFYYCGSPYRWQFGEEEDKGFIVLLQDFSSRNYAVYYQPIISDKYVTINLDDMIDKDPKTIVEYVADRMRREDIKYLRIQITKSNPQNLSVLETYYRNNSNVKIDSKAHGDNVVQRLEEVKKEYSGYDYLFDKNISPEKKLVQYINQSEGSVFITYEDLVDILKGL